MLGGWRIYLRFFLNNQRVVYLIGDSILNSLSLLFFWDHFLLDLLLIVLLNNCYLFNYFCGSGWMLMKGCRMM